LEFLSEKETFQVCLEKITTEQTQWPLPQPLGMLPFFYPGHAPIKGKKMVWAHQASTHQNAEVSADRQKQAMI
jgi:hypothetical protein